MDAQEIQLKVVVDTTEIDALRMNLVDARGYLALARSKIANNNGEAAADVIVVNLAMSLEYVIRFFEHLTVDRS